MSVNVIVQFVATQSNQAAFGDMMAQVSTDLPNIPGCLGVTIYQHSDDLCRFTLIETWESQEAHQTHIKSLVDNGSWAAIEGHLAEAPSSAYVQAL